MKRKICLGIALLLLLLPMAVFPVQAASTNVDWATVNYVYDLDNPGEQAKGGVLSFAKGTKNYLKRYTTLTWNPEAAELRMDGNLHAEGALRVEKAGEYNITLTNKSNGETTSCTVVMLPVVKLGNVYIDSNVSGELLYTAVNFFPVVECLNVDKMALDIGTDSADKDFTSGKTVDKLGRHTLKLTSNGYVTTVVFDVSLCIAEKVFDEELGKQILVLSVGDFGDTLSVTLDGTKPLATGTHKITALGQHRLSATLNGTPVTSIYAFPSAQQMTLQVQLVIPDTTLKEPMTIPFSRWDAVFYVDGKRIEGDYRVAKGGKHVFQAFDKDGNQIENAFILFESSLSQGEVYTEMMLTFRNPHHIYVIFLILPAVLLIAAAIFFFLRRRRIV
jgi:hypothetical protein